MSKCCKCAKWFPHNWLCLKGLSVVFFVFFYITFAYWLVQMGYGIYHWSLISWETLIQITVSYFVITVFCLAMAKILKALHQIKQAVAPCCCNAQADQPAKTQTK